MYSSSKRMRDTFKREINLDNNAKPLNVNNNAQSLSVGLPSFSPSLEGNQTFFCIGSPNSSPRTPSKYRKNIKYRPDSAVSTISAITTQDGRLSASTISCNTPLDGRISALSDGTSAAAPSSSAAVVVVAAAAARVKDNRLLFRDSSSSEESMSEQRDNDENSVDESRYDADSIRSVYHYKFGNDVSSFVDSLNPDEVINPDREDFHVDQSNTHVDATEDNQESVGLDEDELFSGLNESFSGMKMRP